MSNTSTISPELSDVIRGTIDQVLIDVNVCLPGKIISYDKDTQYANVQAQIMMTFSDGTALPITVIPKVPVKHPRANGGKAFVHMPLKPGDDVVLVFSQRSLDIWKSQGGLTNPKDPTKFNITDAYALIGGSAIPDAFHPTTDNGIEIVNEETHFILYPDGKFSVTNETAEFVDLLDQITGRVALTNETLSEDTVNTIFGPEKLLHFETYADIHDELITLQEQLESFKV